VFFWSLSLYRKIGTIRAIHLVPVGLDGKSLAGGLAKFAA
jgi:hypothetical protein